MITYICDFCGNKFIYNTYEVKVTFEFGYGSPHDNQSDEFHFCSKCIESLYGDFMKQREENSKKDK